MAFDLECKDVAKRYGDFSAVASVSLQVPQGSFFSILGPSGCGKTTLLRMIAGFVNPTSGDILIDGRSILGTPPNRRPVNMVFQHLALFPMMNVAENIGYGLRRRGLPREEIARKVDAVLARIGLPGAAAKRIDQLSGGQRQRVAIARCMVLEPTVLLLDEPLGALDLKLREQMKLELKQLQHQFGTTFVYITHDQSEALVMSDQVAVMNAGRFEQIAAPQDLYFAPATAFVAGFVGDSHRWRCRITSVEGREIAASTASGVQLVAVAEGTRLAVGAEADIFVRPEAVAMRPADRGGDAPARANTLTGVLESLLFNGANSRAMVRTSQGDLVAVALQQTASRPDFTEGTPVALSFERAQTLAFPAGGAGS